MIDTLKVQNTVARFILMMEQRKFSYAETMLLLRSIEKLLDEQKENLKTEKGSGE
jgi:hypothetical protein